MRKEDIEIGAKIIKKGTTMPIYTIMYKLTNFEIKTVYGIVEEGTKPALDGYNIMSECTIVNEAELIHYFTLFSDITDDIPCSTSDVAVTSVEQSQTLIDAGIDVSTSDYHWLYSDYSDDTYYLYKGKSNLKRAVPAWSEKTLKSIMPSVLNFSGKTYKFGIKYDVFYGTGTNGFFPLFGNQSNNLVDCLVKTFVDSRSYTSILHKFSVNDCVILTGKTEKYSSLLNKILHVDRLYKEAYLFSSGDTTFLIPFNDEKYFKKINL